MKVCFSSFLLFIECLIFIIIIFFHIDELRENVDAQPLSDDAAARTFGGSWEVDGDDLGDGDDLYVTTTGKLMVMMEALDMMTWWVMTFKSILKP